MGGQAHGDVASKLAASSALQCMLDPYKSIPDLLNDALDAANAAIAAHVAQHLDASGMGTTMVAAIIHHGHIWWASVGDSHLYVLGANGLEKLNADHSMRPILQKLVDEGEITALAASHDPKRNALRSAIMGQEIPLREVSPDGRSLNSGDIVLLSTDGIDSLIEDSPDRILSLSSASAAEFGASIVTLVKALDRPKQDNISLIVACPVQQLDTPQYAESETSVGNRSKAIRTSIVAAALTMVCLLTAWYLVPRPADNEIDEVVLRTSELSELLQACLAEDPNGSFEGLVKRSNGKPLGRAANIGKMAFSQATKNPIMGCEATQNHISNILPHAIQTFRESLNHAVERAEVFGFRTMAVNCISGHERILALLKEPELPDPAVAKVAYPLTALYNELYLRDNAPTPPDSSP